MLELILCSLVTVLPDYLYRRHREGKRWGDQITFFTMWYELRWGITACLTHRGLDHHRILLPPVDH